MTTTIQTTNAQQFPQKKINTLLMAEVATGAVGGAVMGYKFAKPWTKGGSVSDKFVKEVTNQVYKNIKKPSEATTVTTVVDHWVGAAGGFDKLNKYFEGAFKDVKKGVLKPAEEMPCLLKGHEKFFENALKSLKRNSAIKWASFMAAFMATSAILSKALLKKANDIKENKEVK